MKVSFKLNGKKTNVDVSSDTPLLWVLRDTLGMVGTKFGCGKAQCGACTVHLNGMAVRSCQTQIGAVNGQDVTTIEGLGGNHKVQRAWMALDVPQCGYCQPGQIMQASAYLLTIRNQAMLTLIHGCLETFVVVVLTLESALRLKLQLRCLKKE